MPKYRVLAKSFINNAIVEEDAIVEYHGEASDNLALVEDEPKPKAKGKRAEGTADEGAAE